MDHVIIASYINIFNVHEDEEIARMCLGYAVNDLKPKLTHLNYINTHTSKTSYILHVYFNICCGQSNFVYYYNTRKCTDYSYHVLT